jgi:hypothetical protein
LLQSVGVDAGEFEGFEMVYRFVREAVAGAVEGSAAMVVIMESLRRMRIQSGRLWAVHSPVRELLLCFGLRFYSSKELVSSI